MIKINLLPEEFRPKEVKYIIPPELFLMVVLSVFSLVVIVHLYFGGQLLFKSLQYKSLDKQWKLLESQREMADEWKNDYEFSSQQREQIGRLVSGRLTIYDKLEALSSSLPNGVWFNRLDFSQERFLLEGSVVSLKKDQMSLLNVFLKRLKEDKRFFTDFARLELGRMNMRLLGGYQVMNFVVEGDLK
ncbi:hypothetical protein ACFL1D_04285 [Candidatus Omnitrophota bacterium]